MRWKAGGLGVCALAALCAAAAGGPAIVGNAVAAAAGTLFEAAPFVVFAALIGRTRLSRLRPFVGLAGCGCSRGALPGALAIPAIVLSGATFGVPIAAVRVFAALAIAVLAGRRSIGNGEPFGADGDADDIFATLLAVGASAFLAALASAALSQAQFTSTIPVPVLLIAGLALGAIAPCATAGVAIAASFAHVAPALSAGMLATAGLLGFPRFPRREPGGAEHRHHAYPAGRPANASAVALAIALAAIAMRGPSGLINPRLLWPVGAASVAVAATARSWRTTRPNAGLVPAAMLYAAAAGAPPPALHASATRLVDAFAGEFLTFVGSTSRDGAGTTLSRYAITCCRIDATAVSVRLDRTLALPDGRWVEARGTLIRGPDGSLVLHPQRMHAIAVPRDPYLYL
jgi:hypothetical protein